MTHSPQHSDRRGRVFLPGIIATLVFASAFCGLFLLARAERLEKESNSASVVIAATEAAIESALKEAVDVSDTLAAYVTARPGVTPKELTILGEPILQAHPEIAAIAVCPKQIVEWRLPSSAAIYPLKQNLLQNPELAASVRNAIGSKASSAIGPQRGPGGAMLVYVSTAVSVPEKDGTQLWGMVSIAIDVAKLMARHGIRITGSVNFALSASNDGQKPLIFWGEPATVVAAAEAGKGAVGLSHIEVAGLTWDLHSRYAEQPLVSLREMIMLAAGFVAVLLLLWLLIASAPHDLPQAMPLAQTDLLAATGAELAAALESERRSGGAGFSPGGRVYRLLLDIEDTVRAWRSIERTGTGIFDLKELVMALESLYAPVAVAQGLKLSASVESSVPAPLQGDRDTLGRCLDALLGEALAATRQGEISLLVIQESRDAHSLSLRFIVKDEGSVPEPDALAAIFEPFADPRALAASRISTTGLSLHVAAACVRDLGGTLICESASGTGLQFCFSLRFSLDGSTAGQSAPERTDMEESAETRQGQLQPAAEAGVSEAAVQPLPVQPQSSAYSPAESTATGIAPQPKPDSVHQALEESLHGVDTPVSRGAEPAAPEPPPVPQPKNAAQDDASARAAAGVQPFRPKILLAEDGEANREIILRMLRSRTFTADVVTDGKKALEACMKGEYDIVFMDCGMPVMDGFESASRVRQLKGPGRPVIVGMTSSVRGTERERCFASGMNDVIAKPFTLDELVAMIRRHAQPD